MHIASQTGLDISRAVTVVLTKRGTSATGCPFLSADAMALLLIYRPKSDSQHNVRSFCSLGIGEAVNRDDSLHAPQILRIATCTRLRHRWCIRCHWCFRELSAAGRMGDRCRDCRAVVRRAGLAMAAFARASPRGDTGLRHTSILAAGGWSNCCLRHASADNRTALRPSAARLADRRKAALTSASEAAVDPSRGRLRCQH